MPKIKKEPYTKENKKNLFFYEIIGLLLTLIAFFALAKLGTFGFYLNLTFKLLFGDWAFLFIILGIIIGMYFLILHQKIPISSLRLIGIVLVFTAFAILSHFSMHDYVKQYTTSYLSTSINLYFDYFKTANAEAMIGGGLYGTLFFYLLYYLIATPGIIIISLGMIILGISFVAKITLIDFTKLIINFFIRIYNFFKKRGSKVKSFFQKVNDEYSHKKCKKLPKNFIKPIIINDEVEIKEQDYYAHLLKVILNRLNLFHYEVNSYLTPHLLVFTIKSILQINLEELEYHLVNEFKLPFLIKICEDDNLILIEITNPAIRKISLGEALNYMTNEQLFITIDDHNQPVFLNLEHRKMLVFNKDEKSLLFYLVLLLQSESSITVISEKQNLMFISDYVINYHNNYTYLDEIIVNLETIDNQEVNYCLIDLNIHNPSCEELMTKIRYILQLAQNRKYYFIVFIDDYIKTERYFYDAFDYLYNVDNERLETIKLFGFTKTTGLSIKEEGLLKNGDVVMRVANHFISDKEIEKLKNN